MAWVNDFADIENLKDYILVNVEKEPDVDTPLVLTFKKGHDTVSISLIPRSDCYSSWIQIDRIKKK